MQDTTPLEETWRALVQEATATAGAAATLKRVATTLSRAEGYESLKKVRQAIDKVQALEGIPTELLKAARAAATPVSVWLDEEWARRARGFVKEAQRYFEERSVPLDGEGFRLISPPLEIQVHPAKDRADLSYAGEPIKQNLPLVADRLLREREAAIQRLQRAATAPDELAEQLIKAYDRLLHSKELKAGARVRLPDLHFQLFVDRQTAQSKRSLTRGKIKEYPRALFAFDLSGLLAAPQFLVRDGRTIELIGASTSLARSPSTSVSVVAMDGAASTYSDLRVG